MRAILSLNKLFEQKIDCSLYNFVNENYMVCIFFLVKFIFEVKIVSSFLVANLLLCLIKYFTTKKIFCVYNLVQVEFCAHKIPKNVCPKRPFSQPAKFTCLTCLTFFAWLNHHMQFICMVTASFNLTFL